MGEVYGRIVEGEMLIQATDRELGHSRPETTLVETGGFGGHMLHVQTRGRRHVMLECCVLGRGTKTKLIEAVGRIDLVHIWDGDQDRVAAVFLGVQVEAQLQDEMLLNRISFCKRSVDGATEGFIGMEQNWVKRLGEGQAN